MWRTKKTKWLVALGLIVASGAVALWLIAMLLARRIDPYIREQAVLYLRSRFDSEVELASLRVWLPNTSALRILLMGGRGSLARVEGEGIVLRHRGRRDIPPMFAMKDFRFDVDLGTLFGSQKRVTLVRLDGMEIHVPPKGERPDLRGNNHDVTQHQPELGDDSSEPSVLIEEIRVRNAKLVILPRNIEKVPLQFDIYRLNLESVGPGIPMRYDATLTNPKPPGNIRSQGTFGPWSASEPDDTPLGGNYAFEEADLGVFKGISGTLHSTGSFEGTLSSINAQGEASVPDFRLKRSGNPVPLLTRFEVLVDGTNGDTVLKPVTATLGTTDFTTSGAVIRHEGDGRRTIKLDVSMPKGNLPDILRLAMKGPPIMEGQITLKTTIEIPPLSGTVREKLLLDGQFELFNGKFLKSTIQDQIDSLSRRGRGQPKNEEIDEVVSLMGGAFNLENEVITFRVLSFSVPGATVDLTGNYDLDRDVLDFHGKLKLQAKVSETMTGWKRWILKPVDPFFSKQGAGTLLSIQIEGSSKQPKFGRDRGGNDEEEKVGSTQRR